MTSLSYYYAKMLYSTEVTKFPYQMNSHQIFNVNYSKFFCHAQFLFYSDPSLKMFETANTRSTRTRINYMGLNELMKDYDFL